VYAPAKLALFDDPDAEANGELVDVSGAGLRILAAEEIPADEIITVETDQHLILADVRNCIPQGDKFSVGAERIHSAAKLSLPQTTSRAQRNQVLVEDFHRRLREELQRLPDLSPAQATAAAARFKDGHPRPDSGAPASAETTPEMVETPATAGAPEIAEAPAETPVAPVAMPVVSSEPVAVETPLNADTFALHQTAAANARSRAMAILIATVLTLAALLALLFGPFARRAPLQTSVAAKNATVPVSPAASPSPSTNNIVTAPGKDAIAKALTPIPALSVPNASPKPPPGGKTHASITASDRSWITACTDGKAAFSKLFVGGSKDDLVFSERALVRMGSAGSVAIVLNGKPVGSLGRVGEVRVLELTPNASRIITPGGPGDCTN
jgi:hypothetical protein